MQVFSFFGLAFGISDLTSTRAAMTIAFLFRHIFYVEYMETNQQYGENRSVILMPGSETATPAIKEIILTF